MKTDMCPKAVTYRLRKTSELLRLCLALGKNSKTKGKKWLVNQSTVHRRKTFS